MNKIIKIQIFFLRIRFIFYKTIKLFLQRYPSTLYIFFIDYCILSDMLF